MTATHDAILLAAGGSRRLGQPKQLLTVEGETLVARTLRLVAATRPARIVVVLGAYADRIAPEISRAVTVFNPDWETGMASSLRLAADSLAGRGRPVLVVVVDQYRLDETHLHRLLDAYDDANDTVTAYDGAFGVPAVLRPGTLADAHHLRGDEGFRRLWQRGTPRTVPRDALAEDLDTPDDLARAIAEGWIDSPARRPRCAM